MLRHNQEVGLLPDSGPGRSDRTLLILWEMEEKRLLGEARHPPSDLTSPPPVLAGVGSDVDLR